MRPVVMAEERWAEVGEALRVIAAGEAGREGWGRGEGWGSQPQDPDILRSCFGLQGEERNGGLSPGSLLQCSWCDDLHLSSRQSARHLLLHHLAWEAPCPFCSGAPGARGPPGALASHSCSLPCPVCPETCGSRAVLAKHLWSEHRTLYCMLCQHTERTVGEMRAHIEEEEERLARVCVLCGERLKGKKLMEHILKVKNHMQRLVDRNHQNVIYLSLAPSWPT